MLGEIIVIIQCWANINYDVEDKRSAFFGVDSAYETTEVHFRDIHLIFNCILLFIHIKC